MKKVFKYGTGQEIPESAVYLTTKVETLEIKTDDGTITKNVLVWHYFLVEA